VAGVLSGRRTTTCVSHSKFGTRPANSTVAECLRVLHRGVLADRDVKLSVWSKVDRATVTVCSVGEVVEFENYRFAG
jgi:hypothetical protein